MFKFGKRERLAILQYVLIYIMIQYIGGRLLTAVGSDIFYSFTIIFCLILISLKIGNLRLERKFLIFSSVLIYSLMLTVVLTLGDLSLGSVLSIWSRFLIMYVTISIDKEKFISRFLNTVFVFSIISLILFAGVQIIGVSSANNLFSFLYKIDSGKYWLGDSYGLFIICYNFMDPFRNTYMFGEPGEYQSLIILGLYFLVFIGTNFTNRKTLIYGIVFLITIITIQSTTGYFNLIVLIGALVISKKNKIPKVLYRLSLGFIIVVGMYLIVGYSTDSFLYRNFISKISSNSGEIDLSVSTGEARVDPIMRFLDTVNTVPQKLIFGVGYDGIGGTPMLEYSTCGFINSVVMLGIFTNILIYGKMFLTLLFNRVTIPQFIFVLFFVVNMGLSQPDLLAITSVVMCMYERSRIIIKD